VLEALQRMLRSQRKQWQMAFASSGHEALKLLETSNFDVVVTDMRMPEMDGAKLLELVQERHPGVVRLVLSGHVELEVALRAASVAHKYLAKPCDPEELREAIETACDCRAMLDDEATRRIIGTVGRLPSPPATYASLLSVLQEPNADLEAAARIVEQDVAIAAKVLQLVNSAFFGSRRAITNLSSAVNYLGSETLKQLVVSAELLRAFQPSALFGFSLPEFELHSSMAAQIAARLPICEELAPVTQVAALLHDTGKLVLATLLRDRFELALRTAFENQVPLHTVEDEVIGTNHAQVGAYLLKLWGMPEPIVAAARGHHQPMNESHAEPSFDIVGVTHVADALAHELSNDIQRHTIVIDANYIQAAHVADQLPVWREIARVVEVVA